MTWQLDTWHDAGLMWIIDNGHGARIRGDDRWNLSPGLILISRRHTEARSINFFVTSDCRVIDYTKIRIRSKAFRRPQSN
jgi:hypothetical protein